MKKLWLEWKGMKPGTAPTKIALPDGSMVATGCHLPDPGNPQKVFLGNACSINNMDGILYYVNSLAYPPRYESARKGDVIALTCGDVYCPAPAVPNCYYSPGICDPETEFCWRRGAFHVDYAQGVTKQGFLHYCSDVRDKMQRVNTSNGANNGITTTIVLRSV